MTHFLQILFALVVVTVGSTAKGSEALIGADAYTSGVQLNRNFGAATGLAVSASQRAFLKFDLSSLPANLAADQIAKATLQLWTMRTAGSGEIRLFAVNALWDEATITHAQSPQLAATEAASFAVTAGRKRVYATVDVTTLVREWLTGVRVNHGIALVAVGDGAAVRFDSKENMATSHEPRIEIVLNGPEGKQGRDGQPGHDGAKGETGAEGLAATEVAGGIVALPTIEFATAPAGYIDSGFGTADWMIKKTANAASTDSGRLIVAGQRIFLMEEGADALLEYYLGSDTWATNQITIPTPLEGAVVGGDDGFIYVFGGADVNNGVSKAVRRYDLTTGTWSMLPDMPIGAIRSEGIALNGKLYILSFPDVLEYTPSSNSWARLPMPAGFTLGQVAIGDAIYGLSDSGLVRFTPARNEWQVEYQGAHALNPSQVSELQSGTLVRSGDSSLIVFGRSINSSAGLSYRFDTITKVLRPETTAPVVIGWNTVAAYVNGEIILLGSAGFQQVIRVRVDSFKRLFIKQ